MFGLGLGLISKVLGRASLLLLIVLGIQTARLSHAKHDLTAARAALKDPATHRPWQTEAEERTRDLSTCKTNIDTLKAAAAKELARLSALQADAAQRLRQTQAELDTASKGRQSAEARAAKLLKTPPVGVDACARSEAAFGAAKEALR
jgi:chromosome segregation ATPase